MSPTCRPHKRPFSVPRVVQPDSKRIGRSRTAQRPRKSKRSTRNEHVGCRQCCRIDAIETTLSADRREASSEPPSLALRQRKSRRCLGTFRSEISRKKKTTTARHHHLTLQECVSLRLGNRNSERAARGRRTGLAIAVALWNIAFQSCWKPASHDYRKKTN